MWALVLSGRKEDYKLSAYCSRSENKLHQLIIQVISNQKNKFLLFSLYYANEACNECRVGGIHLCIVVRLSNTRPVQELCQWWGAVGHCVQFDRPKI